MKHFTIEHRNCENSFATETERSLALWKEMLPTPVISPFSFFFFTLNTILNRKHFKCVWRAVNKYYKTINQTAININNALKGK